MAKVLMAEEKCQQACLKVLPFTSSSTMSFKPLTAITASSRLGLKVLVSNDHILGGRHHQKGQ